MVSMPPVTCSAMCLWWLVLTPDHYSLGPDLFQLPILQLPKHLLRAVTTNTEVKCVQRIKELPPDLALVHYMDPGVPE